MALTSRSGQVRELASSVITATIEDEDEIALPDTDIQGCVLTLYDVTSGNTINSRLRQDVRNANGVTIDSSGLFTWQMVPNDNQLIDTAIAVGEVEEHIAHVEWAYSGTSVDVTNAFATTQGDNTVTVTLASHGLSIGDAVFVSGCDDVGGLNVNGLWIVATVPTSGTFTFEHGTAATSTVAAGGGVSKPLVKTPKIGRQDLPIQVQQFTKVPGT